MLPSTFKAVALPYVSRVTEAFRELLTDKHLYQSVRIPDNYVDLSAKVAFREDTRVKMPGHAKKTWEEYRPVALKLAQLAWVPDPNGFPTPSPPENGKSATWIFVPMPTIQTFCSICKKRWPFNLVGQPHWQWGREKIINQWFYLSYECQACKTEPVRFLIRRSSDKLTFCGRDPIQAVEVPPEIPKGFSDRYSASIVAFQSGQTLAAIFLLRVFVEQFWHSFPEVISAIKKDPRLSGDKQGEAYKSTLPNDFKERFPTLCEVYSDLSAAMHTANEKPEIYTNACERIVEHFDARRLFKLDRKASADPEPPEPVGGSNAA